MICGSILWNVIIVCFCCLVMFWGLVEDVCFKVFFICGYFVIFFSNNFDFSWDFF